jgi:hypothetical protein
MPPGATIFELPPECISAADIPVEQRRTIETIENCMCRWGIGDTRSPDFFFCGAATAETEPYCIPHAMIAFGGAIHRVDPSKTYRPTSVYPQLKHNGNYRGR